MIGKVIHGSVIRAITNKVKNRINGIINCLVTLTFLTEIVGMELEVKNAMINRYKI